MEIPDTPHEPWYYRLRRSGKLWFLEDVFVTTMETGGGEFINGVGWCLAKGYLWLRERYYTPVHRIGRDIPRKGGLMPQIVKVTSRIYSGNLAEALQKASVSDMGQPGHHGACVGVHCQSHQVFFPDELRFCQTKTFYKTAKFPGRFCKACIEQLEKVEQAGVVMEYQL